MLCRKNLNTIPLKNSNKEIFVEATVVQNFKDAKNENLENVESLINTQDDHDNNKINKTEYDQKIQKDQEKEYELNYKYIKCETKLPKTNKYVILVENKTNEDLIQLKWEEVFENFLNEISKHEKCLVKLVILIKFINDEQCELNLNQKYFQSNYSLATKITAENIINDLCENIVYQTEVFGKQNKDKILYKNVVTKIILNVQTAEESVYSLILKEQLRKNCSYCNMTVNTDTWATHIQTTDHKKQIAENIYENVLPNCLNPMKFFTNIKQEIINSLYKTLSNSETEIINVNINLKLYCVYYEFQNTGFLHSEAKQFETKIKIMENLNNFDIEYNNIATDIISMMNNFQNENKNLALECFYCLKMNIDSITAKVNKSISPVKNLNLKRKSESIDENDNSKRLKLECKNNNKIELVDYQDRMNSEASSSAKDLKIIDEVTNEPKTEIGSKIKLQQIVLLPKWLELKQACINLRSRDIFSFKWAIISAVYPRKHNISRCHSYFTGDITSDVITLKNGVRLDLSGLSFPMKLNQFDIFEKNNPDFSIGVLGCNREIKDITGPHYRSNRKAKMHIHLLFLKTDEQYHFV